MGVQPFFSKRPNEEYVLGLDFTDKLAEGVTLDSGTCSAKKYSDNSSATATILSGGTTVSVNGAVATITTSAGAAGTLYEVVFYMLLSNGKHLEGMARLMVDS